MSVVLLWPWRQQNYYLAAPEKFTGTEMSAALNKIIMCPANENIIAFLGSHRQPYNLCFVPSFWQRFNRLSILWISEMITSHWFVERNLLWWEVSKEIDQWNYEYLLMVLFSAALSFDAETDYAFSAKKKEKYKKNKWQNTINCDNKQNYSNPPIVVALQ